MDDTKINLIEKKDIAKRRPYHYKWKTIEKMEKLRKEKKIKIYKMMTEFTPINELII